MSRHSGAGSSTGEPRAGTRRAGTSQSGDIDTFHGLIAIDKPVGPTSHDVVLQVRRRLVSPGAGCLAQTYSINMAPWLKGTSDRTSRCS